MMQLASIPQTIKTLRLDVRNCIILDNPETKDGITTTAITPINGIKDQTFAFVYPILKNIGICIPVIKE